MEYKMGISKKVDGDTYFDQDKSEKRRLIMDNNQYLRDLKNFKEFLKEYKFTQLEIVENEDGFLVCDGEIVKDNTEQ